MNSGNGLSSSNSNLFVFKNGWTTTMNKDSGLTGPGMFKSRPQSSNNYARRQRNLVHGSERRVWKYNQSNNELVPSIQSLNPNKTQSNFNVHLINKPTPGNRMAVSGNGYVPGGGVKQPTSYFKTSSNHNEAHLSGTSEQQAFSLRESKEILNDTQNSNLMNLNQSAAARQSKNYALSNQDTSNQSNPNINQGWAKQGQRPSKHKVLTRATSASIKNTVPNKISRQSAYEISGPTQIKRPEADQHAIEFGYQKQMNNLFKVVSKPDLANEHTMRTEGTTVETTIQKTFDSHNNSMKDHIKNPMSQKPPRAEAKERPITSGMNRGMFY